MQNTWNRACKDLVSEIEWDDAVSADDTSELWNEPWDLPGAVHYAAHSDSSSSQGGLHDVTGTASRSVPMEQLGAKGNIIFNALYFFLSAEH